MKARVEQTVLPGIGVRHDLITESGRRVTVVTYRNGRRDLMLGDEQDPDACGDSIAITDPEADALAEVLGASVVLSQLSRLQATANGLVTERLPVGAAFHGRTLGDTKARTRTGASIVAVMRGSEVIPSPTPDFVFRPGDTVVAVGTGSGVDGVAEILTGG